MPGKHSFPKSEKLKSLKLIKELFKKGSSFYLYPFRIQILTTESVEPTPFPQVVVSVPKKNIKSKTTIIRDGKPEEKVIYEDSVEFEKVTRKVKIKKYDKRINSLFLKVTT